MFYLNVHCTIFLSKLNCEIIQYLLYLECFQKCSRRILARTHAHTHTHTHTHTHKHTHTQGISPAALAATPHLLSASDSSAKNPLNPSPPQIEPFFLSRGGFIHTFFFILCLVYVF